MDDPKKTETDEATAQEPEAAEADAAVDDKDLEGVAGGGIAYGFFPPVPPPAG